MYIPSAFAIKDRAMIRDFIRDHGFGILISHGERGLEETHAPLMVSEDLSVIYGHIARANPQWRSWLGNPAVKIVFHGPHSYISPGFYQPGYNVPTWNYSAVSIDGVVSLVGEREAEIAIIRDLVSKYEGPSGWKLDLEDERNLRLFDGVVCFSIEVRKIEATFKMNQNKSDEDRESVISHLMESPHAMDRETAKLMRELMQPGAGGGNPG